MQSQGEAAILSIILSILMVPEGSDCTAIAQMANLSRSSLCPPQCPLLRDSAPSPAGWTSSPSRQSVHIQWNT